MSTPVEALETPVPVIDLDRVEHNLAKMQSYADAHGLRLRPHIKTHKLPRFAHRQVALGAVGITCQKLGEAEVMADAGLSDIFISYPLIGEAKAVRLAALAGRVERLAVAADSAQAIATAAQAARKSGRSIGVLIEFDSGNRRTGVVSVEQALTLARLVRDSDGLRFDGLMTYPTSAASAAFVASAAPLLAAENLAPATISGGGTPGARHTHEIAGVTELRVGTYVYHDRTTVALGVATLDECAFHVLATVISRPTPERAVIDAGSKTLSSDLVPSGVAAGHGFLPDYPEAIIERLNEEHGMLDLSACARRPELGEVVRILPNHVCVVSNLHDAVVLSRDGLVVETVAVAARGMTR
jgi:D-serine deaminase-like pyridoxal phosphate-dependent protein